MASYVHNPNPEQFTSSSPGKASPVMSRDFQIRPAITLFLVTAAAIVFAIINFQKEREFNVPSDGIWAVERGGSLIVDRVEADGPGAKAGIKEGDKLVAIDQNPVSDASAQVREMYRVGAWSKATYSLIRNSVPVDATVILVPAEKSLNNWLRLIAFIYLGIGLYVLLRRWTAPGSMHFYIFCLVSFIFYAFKYTGKFNQFDWIIYWSNVTAGLLQPALFLHFVLTFPEKRHFVRKNGWAIPFIYVPGMLLLLRHVLALRFLRASESLRWNLDRLQMGYLALFFVVAAGVLWYSYRRAATPILRQQLKWVTRGTILAITPFTLFYVIPYLTGAVYTGGMKVSVLSLGILPSDLRLRNFPLPLDGRGSYFQARDGLHACRWNHCRCLFRSSCHSSGTGPYASSEFWPHRTGVRDRRHSAAF